MVQEKYFGFNVCYNFAMSEAREGAHGKGRYGDSLQRDILGGVSVPTHRRRKPLRSGGKGLLDDTQPSRAEAGTRVISPEISAFFEGRDLPTDVWAPTGIAYYKRLEDIPDVLFPKTNTPPKIDSWEARSAIALQVCPPMEGEPADASFRLVGERGLYVRVILGEEVNGANSKKPIIRWMHFNEEDAGPKKLRYT